MIELVLELIEMIGDMIEMTAERGIGHTIFMCAVSLFILSLGYLIALNLHGFSTPSESKWIYRICIIAGIITISGVAIHFNNLGSPETVIMYGVNIEYNESEDSYELIGHSFPNRELHRLEIDEELVKTIDPNETSFTVTYEGAKNPYVTRITPMPKVEGFTTPTS